MRARLEAPREYCTSDGTCRFRPSEFRTTACDITRVCTRAMPSAPHTQLVYIAMVLLQLLVCEASPERSHRCRSASVPAPAWRVSGLAAARMHSRLITSASKYWKVALSAVDVSMPRAGRSRRSKLVLIAPSRHRLPCEQRGGHQRRPDASYVCARTFAKQWRSARARSVPQDRTQATLLALVRTSTCTHTTGCVVGRAAAPR